VADNLPAVAAKALKLFDEDRRSHDLWCNKVERWYRAWRGILNERSEAASWRHRLHPPFLLQIIETLAAGLQDPDSQWPVKPRFRAASLEEIEAMRDGAQQLEALLRYQRNEDGLRRKQRDHRLQGLVAGLTVWKPWWRYSERDGKVLFDGPCADVVDVRDFVWHESSRDIQSAARLHHRVWMTFDELKALEEQGVYENVDQLKESRDFSHEHDDREQLLSNSSRTKDRIEVVEHWLDGGARVVTIANRKVVLRNTPNPYDHGSYPFVACSPIPDLFRIPGVSVVELVEDLQEMLWTLTNQRLDNLELINNAIFLVRDDVLDPNSFVFAPGEQWLVSDKDAVTPWAPDVRLAEVSLNAEALVKADLQNIPGASPALLGQSGSTEQTATEISLLTNLAQRRLAIQKQQFTLADIEVGHQWIALNRQYLDEKKYVEVVGPEGEDGLRLIDPESFRDFDFAITVDQMDESMIRQERLAEAQARLQVAVAAVPVFAAIGTPVNAKAFMEDYLKAAGVQDTERYFSAQPQPAALQQGQGGQQQPPGLAGGALDTGATAPQAMDANSPSNSFSQSPAAAMQQLLSMSGGVANGS